MSEVKDKIENLIGQHKILVFMKGTKLMPQCGFSNNVVQILNSLGVPFETVDVLEDSEITDDEDTSDEPNGQMTLANGT